MRNHINRGANVCVSHLYNYTLSCYYTKTSLFLLATAPLQALAAPATTDATILVKSKLEAGSLTNIY